MVFIISQLKQKIIRIKINEKKIKVVKLTSS